jgi:protein gp37
VLIPGDNCYARDLAKRLKGWGNPRYQKTGHDKRLKIRAPGFGLTLHWDKLDDPDHWLKPRMVFVNSMSDLFHPEVPDDFIAEVFQTMRRNPDHTFQILTKRPRRMLTWTKEHRSRPLPNVWLGTSVEDQKWADNRIPLLERTPAKIRFVSIEPQLDRVDLKPWIIDKRPRIHWVIQGGESGPRHRPFDLDWARLTRDQCRRAGVAYFLKQIGGVHSKAGGHRLDRRVHREYPVAGIKDRSAVRSEAAYKAWETRRKQARKARQSS